MAKHRKRRTRRSLGLLTTEQLLAHRELEFLRVAGRPTPRRRGARKQPLLHVQRRAVKLEVAKQLAALEGSRAAKEQRDRR